MEEKVRAWAAGCRARPAAPCAVLSLRRPWRHASALTYFFHSPTLSSCATPTLRWGMGSRVTPGRSDFFFHLLYPEQVLGVAKRGSRVCLNWQPHVQRGGAALRPWCRSEPRSKPTNMFHCHGRAGAGGGPTELLRRPNGNYHHCQKPSKNRPKNRLKTAPKNRVEASQDS